MKGFMLSALSLLALLVSVNLLASDISMEEAQVLKGLAMESAAPDFRPWNVAATEYPPSFLRDMAAVQNSVDSLRTDESIIFMRAIQFDPLREGAPHFQISGFQDHIASETDLYIVQYFRDLEDAERRKRESDDLQYFDYIPNHSYLVQATRAAAEALAGDPELRWMGLFSGGFKVDPGLLAPDWGQPVVLSIRLVPGGNPFLLLGVIREAFPQAAYVSLHGDMDTGSVLRVLVDEKILKPFVTSISEDPSVWSLDPYFLPHAMNNASVWVVQNYDTTNTTNYTLSATMWNHGITGTGQTPAVSDTGCDSDMCFFRLSSSASAITDAMSPMPTLPGIGTPDPAKKVIAYYVMPGATSYDGNTTCGTSPESWHGTHVCGSVLGDNYATLSTPAAGGHDAGDGMAPNAKLIFQDAGNETTGCLDGLSADNYLIFQQAYNAGARIHSNSWGGDTAGVYTGDCQLVDRFIYDHEDFQLFFANGNAGSGTMTVGSPAAAKNCVSIGATTNGSIGANAMASFSSRGPTADGRRKPDICAPGSSIVSAAGTTNHTDNNCSTKTLDGTSMATPTAAGAATLMRQYFTDGFYPTGAATAADAVKPSAALLKAALVNGAVDIGKTTQATMLNGLTPDNNQGFGRVALDTVSFFSTPSRDARRLRFWDRWNATGLKTGNLEEFPLQVASGQPLKVTLVWTDPQASTISALNLVNNLDLEVVAPDGSTIYKGNYFAGGQSAAGGTADYKNNVEEVFLTAPASGTWTLRVKAMSVPGTPAQPYSGRQGFALAATYGDCVSALAAPASLVAIDNGTTGIDLSWPAVTGAARYQIYRASGDCSTAAAEFHYLAQTADLSFTDTLVQGGYPYAYKVRAVDDCSEGAASNCATAVFSGNCKLYPTFGGLTSAANDTGTTACDVVLTWPAGTSNCTLGPTIKYNVYRGYTPYFSVGGASRLAAGLAGTTYRDTAVDPNTTYYYIVRAEDGTTANGGPSNGGNEDLNTVMLKATPTAATFSNGTWTDTGGDGSRAYLTLDSPWRVTNQQNHTTGGSFCYHAGPDGGTYPAMTCASAATTDIPLQAGQAPVLSYWIRYNVEYQWDGVVVEISTNGGGAWTILAPAEGYTGDFSTGGGVTSPINACSFGLTQACFNGPSGNAALTAWTMYTHALSSYAGQNVRIRWRLSTDPGAEFEGFYLDDITITYAGTPNDCATCANNPSSVDVTPDGPFALCTSTPQLLTATPAGGTGPFAYQWTRDGLDIGGATNSTYTASDTGSHAYNCKISGSGCTIPKSDRTAISISWRSAPYFSGIGSVTNAESSTCTLNLAWPAGTAICSGPLVYNVYRPTSWPFEPDPANQIAAGVTGISYQDLEQLVDNATYYYIVRAVDSSNGMEETNTIVLSGIPTGPITTSNIVETFEGVGGFDNTGWTHQAITGSVDWVWSAAGNPHDGTHTWFSASQGSAADRVIVTPTFGALSNTTLEFWHTYAFESATTCYDGGTLEISTDGGSAWSVIPGSAFTAGAYTGTVSASSNPINGKAAWCGGTIGTMTRVAVNLSGYAGQNVKVRWHAGEDSSSVVTGWYIDSVTIINAGTASACASGSNCANNPTQVSVTPDGPLTLCAGTAQLLTATPTGGVGTAYQWYDGLNPIGGATSSTYSANATGTHNYNCQVKGAGCTSAMSDASATQITWQAEPTFAGLTSVTNPQQATCRLDLAWSAGSTPCAGGVTYNVYRDTTPGFTPGSGNLIATGLSGTAYQDSNGLVNLTTYYYKTRAVTVANGIEETNLVERSGAPTGSGSSSVTLFSESFDGTTFPPTDWTTTVVTTSSTPPAWARVTTSTNPTGISPHSGGGMAEFNSYHAQSGGSNRLARTANLNIAPEVTTASAVLWVYHETGFSSYTDRIQVQTSPDGTTWTNRGTAINRYDGTTGWKQHTIDLSALIGAGNFLIGYLGVSNFGNDTYLDDVSVNTVTLVACTTGSVAPPPVKDSGAGAAKFTKGGGDTLDVTYDAATCSAENVIILHGALDDFTGYDGCAQPSGGSTGSTTIDSAGQSATWYNLVWTTGTTAGHPGFATGGARNWNVGTLCGMATDNKTHPTCP